jgi:hypothetical protein
MIILWRNIADAQISKEREEKHATKEPKTKQRGGLLQLALEEKGKDAIKYIPEDEPPGDSFT